jgi:hypothetical protein
METKVSYAARFFTKFIEITAAGLATAVSAYLIAQLGGLLSSVTPAPAAVQVGPAAGDVAKNPPVRTAAPVAAAAVTDDQRPAPQADTDAFMAQATRKPGKTARDVPPRKDGKTDGKTDSKTGSVTRGERSVEALARAALAKVDADQPAPAEAPPRAAEPLPPLVAVQIPVQVPVQAPVQAPVQVPVPSQSVVAIAPPPSVPAPLEASTSAPELPPIHHGGLFAVLKRMPDLLRPEPPASVGEAIRPPMPIGPAAQD